MLKKKDHITMEIILNRIFSIINNTWYIIGIVVAVIAITISVGVSTIFDKLIILLGNTLFYTYIAFFVLLTMLMIIIILLYKSKSTEQSFAKFKSNFDKLIVNMAANEVSFYQKTIM